MSTNSSTNLELAEQVRAVFPNATINAQTRIYSIKKWSVKDASWITLQYVGEDWNKVFPEKPWLLHIREGDAVQFWYLVDLDEAVALVTSFKLTGELEGGMPL